MVVYHNDFNRVVLRSFTAEEMNIFIALLVKLRDEGTSKVFIDTDEFKELIDYSNMRRGRYEETLENAIRKILQVSYIEKKEKKLIGISLFAQLLIDLEETTITAEVSKYWDYIINNLSEGNFTSYELEEFVRLKSTYSKTVYRFLKQNKTWTEYGKTEYAFKEFTVDEFRLLLDIPSSYNTSAIKRQIIDQVEKELSPLFQDFKIKIIKAKTRGTPVIAYRFMFKPQRASNKIYDPEKFKKQNKPRLEYDNRMTREEKKAFIEEKMKRRREMLRESKQQRITEDGIEEEPAIKDQGCQKY